MSVRFERRRIGERIRGESDSVRPISRLDFGTKRETRGESKIGKWFSKNEKEVVDFVRGEGLNRFSGVIHAYEKDTNSRMTRGEEAELYAAVRRSIRK